MKKLLFQSKIKIFRRETISYWHHENMYSYPHYTTFLVLIRPLADFEYEGLGQYETY